jgi:hypothetical protein
VSVSTGPLQILIPKRSGGLIESVKIDSREVISDAGKGLVIQTAEGREVAAGAPGEVAVELAGPMRAVVRVTGDFGSLQDGLLRYTARISAFAGQKLVKVYLWLENHGADGQGKVKPEWFAFDGMAVEFSPDLGGKMTAQCEGVQAEGRFKLLQVCNKGDKPPYFTDKNFQYTISSGEDELKKGERTDGLVRLRGENGSLSVGIRHFWQNYEKAIELDGAALRLWLWPTEGQWPRPTKSAESYRLRRLAGIARDKLYLLPGSVHKGHEFVLDFSGRPVQQTAAALSRPVFARATAEYYAVTGALPGFFTPDVVKTGNRNCDFKLAAWSRMSQSAVDPASASSLFAARSEYQQFHIGYHGDSSQWYGWMDFGDLSVPGVGQASLHYDWPFLVLSEYLRHGGADAIELAGQMVRHRVDVDQYWSDRDPSEINGVQSGNVWPAFHADGRSGGRRPGPRPYVDRRAGPVVHAHRRAEGPRRLPPQRRRLGPRVGGHRRPRRLRRGPQDRHGRQCLDHRQLVRGGRPDRREAMAGGGDEVVQHQRDGEVEGQRPAPAQSRKVTDRRTGLRARGHAVLLRHRTSLQPAPAHGRSERAKAPRRRLREAAAVGQLFRRAGRHRRAVCLRRRRDRRAGLSEESGVALRPGIPRVEEPTGLHAAEQDVVPALGHASARGCPGPVRILQTAIIGPPKRRRTDDEAISRALLAHRPLPACHGGYAGRGR